VKLETESATQNFSAQKIPAISFFFFMTGKFIADSILVWQFTS